jgi:hypothetical protein
MIDEQAHHGAEVALLPDLHLSRVRSTEAVEGSRADAGASRSGVRANRHMNARERPCVTHLGMRGHRQWHERSTPHRDQISSSSASESRRYARTIATSSNQDVLR